MPANSSLIGTIAVQPDRAELPAGARAAADDSSLAALLASLAHSPSLGDDAGELRLVASARLSRYTADDCGLATVRADLVRLVDDLAREYELLADR